MTSTLTAFGFAVEIGEWRLGGSRIGVYLAPAGDPRTPYEQTPHIAVAAIAIRWDLYYLLLWWIVAYRYIDVGPRRALQKLDGTPELKAARPWAPVLNWVVITTLYVLTYFVVANQWLVFAKVSGDGVPTHVAATWEYAVVFGVNLALALLVWRRVAKYTTSLMPGADKAVSKAGAPRH